MGYDKSLHALNKYLAKHAESETSRLNDIDRQYRHTLVIPLYDESFDDVCRLIETPFEYSQSATAKGVLFILVVNAPLGGDEQAHSRTAALLQQLTRIIDPVFNNEGVIYGKTKSEHGLILVDRCSDGRLIPKKQGVGLARKIGADIACQLITIGTVEDHWIHSTDADVVLPADYFKAGEPTHAKTCVEGAVDIVALVYPFKHLPEQGYEIACTLYDWSLRYYVNGLMWAGSGYAYHTIGSLIAVDYEAYAKVRGFPKRAGGEDFYLLNKLAKLGVIHSLNAPVIDVAARPSQRVPFGTGPALNKIAEYKQAVDSFTFYHPAVFQQLKAVLTVVNQSGCLRGQSALESFEDILLALKKAPGYQQKDQHYRMAFEIINCTSIGALDTLGFVDAWQHAITQSNNDTQFLKHIRVWFDAFKTLKFIHYLREQRYPSITLNQLLIDATFLNDDLRARAESLLKQYD